MKKTFFPSLFLFQIFKPTKAVLDFTGYSLRFCKIARKGQSMKIFDLKEEIIENPLDRSSFLNSIRKIGLTKNQSFILSFSGTAIHSFSFDLPGVKEEEIHSLIKWEIEKKLPLPEKDIYYSYKKMQGPSNQKQPRWNISVMVAKKEDVNHIYEWLCCENFKVEKIFLSPFHCLELLTKQNLPSNTGFIISSRYTLEIYLLSYGKVTQSLFYSTDIKSMNAVTIKNITDFFAQFSQRNKKKIEAIYIVNRENFFPENLKKAIQNTTELLLESAEQITNPSISPYLPKCFPYYDLLGLLISPLKELEITPPYVKKMLLKKHILKGVKIVLLILNLISLTMLPTLLNRFIEYNKIQQARKATVSKTEEIQKLSSILSKVDELILLKRKQRELIEKIELLENTGVPSSRIRFTLFELSRLMPENARIKRLHIIPGKVELDGEAKSSDGMDVLIKNLNLSRNVRDIILKRVDLNNNEDGNLSFTLEFGVK